MTSAIAGLGEFYQVFFEEAAENLDRFEQLLLELDPAAPADEAMNAIFRCAHSVKGGAATFGFDEMTSLTHAMETLLDRLRRHEQGCTPAMVDTLLQAGDLLRAMLAARQDGGASAPDAAPLLAELVAHTGAQGAHAPAAAAPAAGAAPAAPAATGPRELEMLAGPLASPSLADDLLELFREVTGAGTLERVDPLPDQAEGFVRFRLGTTSSDEEVLDLCGFHVPREQIRLAPWPQPVAAAPAPAPEPAPVVAAAAAPSRNQRSAPTSETLRVSLEKVDQLINLMGELVINQAMLAQRASRLDRSARQQLQAGLLALDRTTRDLQGSVMAIRMIPMGDVFQRFPRMLRDLAARLGKQLELRTVGESTELDKGMIEKITDPLTHLVRNSVDHGIELPDERIAAGKPPHGTLTLAARHEGGCIVIEVQDDGRGLHRERILDKARRNGIAIAEDASDADVWQLIFAPGFSTAEAVTDISGRGVGMDVVRRNIMGLGGSVELDSAYGRGTTVRVRLPLTLAIMDGISVAIGGELYLLPLGSVIESFQAQPAAIRRMPPAHRVVKVRDEYVPIVSLAAAMDAPARTGPGGAAMLVLVQAEGRRVVLEVDRLVGQQQVVVKNLEANYQRVPGVSGATIMGDGSVALIVDVAALVRGAPQLPSSPEPGGRQTGEDAADTATTETLPA